ncbi:MAG: tRNA (adenosine(37)-N6)-threonylcarbamoyltransferase complex ATPase subunit type 1 TsaE [Cellvibrionaceae bacterium]|nr:tRNA (adenosine(37)-N6)-threonylcarbamoyltransferase complex ATPase subunit type 1 TsaE [Cellvibrionaceae bacterium]
MSVADLRFQLTDEVATVDFGRRLAKSLRGGAVVFLQGTLGAGKTTLTRGVLQELGHAGAVKSPTYTLVEPYELSGLKVFHFDLYRLGDPEELEYMGIRDYFLEQNLCIVEWPMRGAGILPSPDLSVDLTVSGTGRLAIVTASTRRGDSILQSLITQPLKTQPLKPKHE